MQHAQYRLQSSESYKLHNWELNLINSAALGREGHGSFSVFHNTDSSLFILPNYILTLENHTTRAVTSLNSCHSKTFCNALGCLPSRLFEDWTRSSRSEQLVHIQLFEALCVLRLRVIKAAATPAGPRHLVYSIYLFGSATGKLALTLPVRLQKQARTKSVCVWLGWS